MMLTQYYNEICEPYEFEKENAAGGIEIVRKLTDCIGGSEKSLIRLVKQFIGSGKTEGDDAVVDEDEDVPAEGDVESIASEPEDACEQLNSELQA
jgi:hypothetical protein